MNDVHSTLSIDGKNWLFADDFASEFEREAEKGRMAAEISFGHVAAFTRFIYSLWKLSLDTTDVSLKEQERIRALTSEIS